MHITMDLTQNPPPAEKFSNFSHFEIRPIVLVAPYKGQSGNEAALKKIQENVSQRVDPVLGKWNSAATTSAVRTLVIEPSITEIKFINGTARFWSGGMLGSSAVLLEAKISEKETGKTIATPSSTQNPPQSRVHLPLGEPIMRCLCVWPTVLPITLNTIAKKLEAA